MSTLSLRLGSGAITVSGKLRLRYLSWEATDARAAVVVVHGLAEHAGRYDRLGRYLAQAEISTFALDLRGHGRSEGRRGHVPSFGTFLQDLDRFRREVRGLVDPQTPLFLLGHSMGGLIALRYQQEYAGAFSGLIALSPWLATAVRVPRWKITLANTLNRVLPSLPFRARLRSEQLTHDVRMQRAHDDDPLVHDIITPRLFVEVSSAMGTVFQRIDRLRSPALFLLAGADPLVDTERSVAFAQSLASREVTWRVYPGYYHELLNEAKAGPVYRDLRSWLTARLT
jgi:lysophospholipase